MMCVCYDCGVVPMSTASFRKLVMRARCSVFKSAFAITLIAGQPQVPGEAVVRDGCTSCKLLNTSY